MSDLEKTHVYRPAGPAARASDAELPRRIDRYRIQRVVGEGGFGIVYLAHDEQLQRPVAVKVPHRHLIAKPEDAEAYLAEARMVANLDHPNIVPVFDVGSTEDCLCFVVSKFIDGTDLATRLLGCRLPVNAAAELVTIVAKALHHAHKQGLVHRDVKPGNILLDKNGQPFVVDFGLALRDQDVGSGARYAGTPVYMSPEQARGEGHRVDGRSDIFSLGVVLYELLTGRRPFLADAYAELMEQITSFEPRPPRQYDDRIPKELERICLKALSKRASERYTTATDMADDLQHFLAEHHGGAPFATGTRVNSVPEFMTLQHSAAASTPAATPAAPMSTYPPVTIVPKGLRSFDEHDAAFILELLPGPRNREGLPDSIQFWKTRIEETDVGKTFAVGLIYGPSGCGKSSLVKAGLLPRLADSVIVVYLEATAGETEARLLNLLRKRCPELPAQLGLKESMAALRCGFGVPAGRKVLIVMDQFEQWLHAKKDTEHKELVQALRQCDGERVQGIVMVRDDFWMGATRLLRELEIHLLEGQNSSTIDLFDLDHAKKVLAAFGHAFGKLSAQNKEGKDFLDQAVAGLAQEGKIIPVRLALFAEMMKSRPWRTATLKEVGGAEGVRVRFLEETFTAATAPARYRLHQNAAKAVLKALLPEAGTDIKGHMRSYSALLEASGYTSRPRDFDDLIRILDSEIRLITPKDPEEEQEAPAGDTRTDKSAPRYYQLTHDYLVPSLRDWLTSKQKETTRGRAELLLADRASVWNARPENGQLPSLLRWLKIRLLTRPRSWTPAERRLMAKAGRYHALRGLVLAIMLAVIAWAGRETYGTLKAHALRDQLLSAETKNVPRLVEDMGPYRRWIDPLLRAAYQKAEASHDARPQLHASMALLPADAEQTTYLFPRLLDAAPQDIGVLCDALGPHQMDLRDRLWAIVEQPAGHQEEQRLRAACALARYDPRSRRWAQVTDQVVRGLVAVQPFYLQRWMEALWPARAHLIGSLAVVSRDRDAKRDPSERAVATNILAEYAADAAPLLADVLMDGDAKQFPYLYPKLRDHGAAALALLGDELAKRADRGADSAAKERLARRQANAAVATLRMGRPAPVWPLLKHSPDPRLRSYVIDRLGPLGADARDIAQQLRKETDVEVRRALILSLGEFTEAQLPPLERSALSDQLLALYERERDAGLHGAAEWLLRTWGEENRLKAAADRLRTSEAQRRVHRQQQGQGLPSWYVNGEGQTMVVIPGPVQFLMGSPPDEVGRGAGEIQHLVRIGRTFAIGATAVTVGQYRRLYGEHAPTEKRGLVTEYPVVQVSWLEAAEYCNWLSKQLGIDPDQWCYETDARGRVSALCKDYLRRTGYRLPTEAEMEYAIRAGAVTSRYYGDGDELLVKYGWFVPNSGGRIGAVGRLKPNDFGLFDMHGNVWCWCQERSREYPRGADGQVFEDTELETAIPPRENRVLRGDCYTDHATGMRSASRWGHVPGHITNIIGFRLARTMAAN